MKYAFDTVTVTAQRQTNYAYDPAGNRQSVIEDPDGTGPTAPVTTPYSTNDLNQYTAIDSLAAPVHDADGNLTQHQPRLSDAVWTYTYDAQNRLTSGTSSTGDSFTFAYDPRNRCVSRTITPLNSQPSTLILFYDGWSLIEERTPADSQLARNIHGAGMDELLARTTPASTVYYQHDALGSTTALTDSAGAVVERVTYDAYGLPSFLDATGTPIPASAHDNRFLFTGREWFGDLRLQDNRHRYYSPDTGRWLSRDPIEEEGGINLYGYVRNKPVTIADRLGLVEATEVKERYSGKLMFEWAWPTHPKTSCPERYYETEKEYMYNIEIWILWEKYGRLNKIPTALVDSLQEKYKTEEERRIVRKLDFWFDTVYPYAAKVYSTVLLGGIARSEEGVAAAITKVYTACEKWMP